MQSGYWWNFTDCEKLHWINIDDDDDDDGIGDECWNEIPSNLCIWQEHALYTSYQIFTSRKVLHCTIQEIAKLTTCPFKRIYLTPPGSVKVIKNQVIRWKCVRQFLRSGWIFQSHVTINIIVPRFVSTVLVAEWKHVLILLGRVQRRRDDQLHRPRNGSEDR